MNDSIEKADFSLTVFPFINKNENGDEISKAIFYYIHHDMKIGSLNNQLQAIDGHRLARTSDIKNFYEQYKLILPELKFQCILATDPRGVIFEKSNKPFKSVSIPSIYLQDRTPQLTMLDFETSFIPGHALMYAMLIKK
jgi:hypothetical protein